MLGGLLDLFGFGDDEENKDENSGGSTPKDSDSWYEDPKKLGTVLDTVLGIGGLYFGNKQAKESLKAQEAAALRAEQLKRELAGKGGGGSGAAAANQRTQLMMEAYDNWIKNNQQSSDAKANALKNLQTLNMYRMRS